MPVSIMLGPVLSFRGTSLEGGDQRWRVSLLVGVRGDAPPAVRSDGKDIPLPRLLLAHKGVSYFRYDLSVLLDAKERVVNYTVADAGGGRFTVPSVQLEPRIAYVSCNGFTDPTRMRNHWAQDGAVWSDLLENHDKAFRPADYKLDREQVWHETNVHDKDLQRFHLLLMGGDQIYFDSIWEKNSELKAWTALSREKQLRFKLTQSLREKIEDYYFGLYAERWNGKPKGSVPSGTPASRDAVASIPTVMMWDDHDIFDGWGSYSSELQKTELFQWMFRCARRAFWVFQMQHALADLPELQPRQPYADTCDPQFEPTMWCTHMAHDDLRLPLLDGQPGFSSAFFVGPICLIVLDLRTERSRDQILGEYTWRAWQRVAWDVNVPGEEPRIQVDHLLIMSSVPVAHPKLTLAEAFMDTFGRDDVQHSNADDLRDHWNHDAHEGERKRLIQTLTGVSESKRVRVAILSGDVHVAAWGAIYRKDRANKSNRAELHQFTSSAIVHPSLSTLAERAYLAILNNAASKPQPIDVEHEVQMMLFPGHGRYVMPARNWLAVELAPSRMGEQAAKLWATWRCETPDHFSNHLYALQPAT
jgi:hypothetical protein